MRQTASLLIASFLLLAPALAQTTRPKVATPAKNVIFIMTDGLRWQEVFHGADLALMNKQHGKVTDVAALKAKYWRPTVEERRKALMPFFWSTIAIDGQVFGDRDRGSDAYVTNGLNFSYPGYSETLTGFADPRINSNDKVPNPNVTVLEWLNNTAEFHDKVAAFGAWDVIGAVFHPERAKFTINAGYDPLMMTPMTPRLELLNQLKAESPRVWEDEPFDPIPFYTAMEYLKTKRPRVLYISFGDTDDWAHDGNYKEYLDAAHRVDAYIARLWKAVQENPQYRGKTALLFSPDHGRGAGLDTWRDHGQKLPESRYIWMGFLGADVKPMGDHTNIQPVTQNEIAATLAELLGKDYHAAVPQSGAPISGVAISASKQP